jgi:hypothetical protein
MEMVWWTFAGWGLFGGFVIDGLDLWKVVRSNGGSWPRECCSIGFFVAEFIRLIAGAGLALALGQSGQVNGPIGALAVGVAAPLIAEKLAQAVPALPGPVGENK